MMEAMIYRVRIGCPWRDLPEVFGPWKSVYTRWRRWNHSGLWEAVLDWLRSAAEGQLRHLDATYIKLHQDATNPAGGQCLQAIGRTKGGLNTKLTALVDGRGRALQLRVDAGPRSDFQIAEAITPPYGKRVIADKGYDSDKLREHFATGGARTVIPARKNRSEKVSLHRGWYRLRHRVENFFQRMKRFRAISTRYDKLSLHFLSSIRLVAVLDWICFRV